MNKDEMYNHIVQETKEYIQNNYHRDITLNELAEKYYITISYLSKIFKQVTGTTFKKYLNIYRVNQAKAIILSHGFCTMSEISSRVGYNDVSYFYKVFNKIEGTTPTAYKERAKQKEKKVV